MSEASTIRLKVAQYYIDKAQKELAAKDPQIQVGDWDLLQSLPRFVELCKQHVVAETTGLAAAAPPLPPLPPMIPESHISWKDLLASDLYGKKEPDGGGGHMPSAPAPGPTPRIPPAAAVPEWYRVAIIGSGVAGLRSAKLLEELNIPYDLLEASDRTGGRIYTYKFTPTPESPEGLHDYYDVGAMRFPQNAVNKITFDLFDELNLMDRLNKYVMSNDNNILFFNGRKATSATASTPGDHFQDEVPGEYLYKEAVDLSGNTVYGVNACTAVGFDDLRKGLIDDFKTGWEELLKYDWASTRSYLAREKPQFPLSVIQWMENRNSGTGGYNESLTETILESFNFDDPAGNIDWWCIEGGTRVLTDGMADALKVKPIHNSRVTAVDGPRLKRPQEVFPNLDIPEWQQRLAFPFVQVQLADNSHRQYTHVISTVPFSNLGMINTDNVPMSYNQRQAIRSLNYGPSVKVAIKFKSRWWEQNGQKQFGGSSYTDRPTRVVVYPSYGLTDEGPGVLLVSYSWNQDALRLGSLVERSNWSDQLDPARERPASEQVLLDCIYEDLAILHDVSAAQLAFDTLDYHAFDWYGNPFTMGAFAMFTPAQFGALYPDIVQPAGYGRFHFAGEVASGQHAWVSGALDSAVRAVEEIVRLDFPESIDTFQNKFGRSSAFVDEEHAKIHFTKGIFSQEIEAAELRKA